MPVKRERTPMPVQEGYARVGNFAEVALGYLAGDVREEADRCLQCKTPYCEEGCPVGVPIKEFIKHLQENDYLGAIRTIKRTNALPAVCGRVCPQEDQCEKVCIMGKRFQPVAIGRLERFAADWERVQGLPPAAPPPPNGKKVAVVGGGPAGLTAAGQLAAKGYAVTVFEALHEPGGVLSYGIPEFRLPKEIVRWEIQQLKNLGVEIRTNVVVGKSPTLDELKEGYDAVFLGTGAGLPVFMGIPGENLVGVYSANEFLTRVNLMGAASFPEVDTPVRIGTRVAVIGAGNTAMDSVRTARRVGAKEAYIVYRRSEAEMSARAEEFEHAQEEGVQFMFLTNPVRFLGDDEGRLRAVECQRMALGEPDLSGRRRPVPIPGSEFELAVDAVIMALGTSPNPLLLKGTEGLASTARGGIKADETGATSLPGIWAGGDAVSGAATVIMAMGAGKKAAEAIDQLLSGGES